MQYTRLGNTGLIVSRLSFGAMTFGSYHSIPAIFKVDQENARAMVERALEAGVNFFDTADTYSRGQAQAILRPPPRPTRPDLVVPTQAGFPVSPLVRPAR